ncbi:MAG: NADH-quinone oxidoreductase subunit D [Anaerolineales bacterium]|nr:NADH-quinone oxidoreductase subunit D [Anaerolineales bacterium]
MTEQLIMTDVDLAEKFPQKVKLDERKGYEGYLVDADAFLDVAKHLRDELGYDYLSSITGVDYYPENYMESVYHFFRTTGGPALVLKVQIPRDNAVVPSLVSIYPGAEFQEREAWDLLGIRYEGHPDLRRILMWEGFAGHPLRKDWREPYYEEDGKPFKSRWPDGHVYRIEDKNPFHKNVDYPADFDPDQWVPDNDSSLYASLTKIQSSLSDSGLKTDTVIVNMGPQHPSTHGVFRMVVLLEGETIRALKPVMGYLHRNHEKIGERNTYLMNMPFTDRLDYLSSMSNNFGYALAVEKLMGIKPPERAEYLRVIMAEFTRISNHLFAIGSLLNDLGAYFTPMLYAIEERELILDVFEAVAGSRMMCNYFRFGGVARDLPEGVYEKIRDLAYERLPRRIDELDLYLTNNEIIRARCEGVGILTPEQAIAYSASGPLLRASGVPYDIRRADPYSVYDRFEFDVAVRYHGDVYDRYLVRMDEIRQSIRILQQAIRDLPEGPIQAGKPQYQVRVPPGEAYGRVEAPKGELGFYVVSNGKPNPWRYHVRAPSFINITALETMAKGNKVADSVAILGSIDIVLGELDR